jgi:hypothetical protein
LSSISLLNDLFVVSVPCNKIIDRIAKTVAERKTVNTDLRPKL